MVSCRIPDGRISCFEVTLGKRATVGITGWLTASAHHEGAPLAILSALLLIVLVARAMLPKKH
ncbi:MAG: hypothetical protein WBP54_08755 [Pelodictyon phaeoclathratiforme]